MRLLNLHIPVKEIPLARKELNHVMGFEQDLPTPFDGVFKKISAALKTGKSCAEAIIFDNDDVAIKQNKIIIKNVEFNTGNKVTSYLNECNGIALFICTLGAEFEVKMKSFKGDHIENYFADTIGSLKCETLANILYDKILNEIEKEKFTATNRYSPGYCNWDVSEQKKLFSFFKDTKTGISLNDSSLMLPVKSISGLIGIGKNVKKMPYSCSLCSDINCSYRKLKTQ